MTHFFLQDPENLRAFQHLTAVPIGTVRTWAEALGWKKSRMERFLLNLQAHRLAEIDARSKGSTFRPISAASVRDTSETRPAANQEPCSGLTEPRLRKGDVEKIAGADLLIEVVNDGLRHHDSYLPISADNYGSHRAAKHWLSGAGIPLEEAIVLLRRKVMAFDLDKSGDEYPRSLGYFTKAVLSEWKRLQRDRQQLPLLPDLKLEVA